MRFDWRSALGLALSALLLWWTLRGENLAQVWDAITTADWRLFALATVAATAIFPIRARKWRTILEPVAGRVAFDPLWRATAIGMAMNNVIPARVGELARAYALTRDVPRVSFPTSLASLAVDRVFDAIVLLGLMFAAVLDPAFPSTARIQGMTVPTLARGGIAGVVVLLAALYALVAFPVVFERAFLAIVGRISPRLADRGAMALRAFADGLGVLRHPGRFAAVLGWTLLHWLVHALGFWLGFRAVGIDTPFTTALFLQGLMGIAVAVPSSPGFFGVFESAAKVGLALYGVSATLAVSWAFGYHILTFIPITVIGAVYFARMGLRLGDVAAAGRA